MQRMRGKRERDALKTNQINKRGRHGDLDKMCSLKGLRQKSDYSGMNRNRKYNFFFSPRCMAMWGY